MSRSRSTLSERDTARRKLTLLPGQRAVDEQIVQQQNDGLLDAYRRRLHEATDDTNEALESIKVAGLQRLEDQVASTAASVLGLKGAFGDLVGSVIADLARLEIKKGILGVLGKAGSLSGIFAGGGGDAGLASSIVSQANSALFGGRASGGNVVGGVPYLVGEHGPEPVVFPSSGKVYPNGALPTIAGGGQHTTIIAPQHFDLTGVVMTEQLVGQMEQRNRAYANQVAARAGSAAVQAAPGRLQQIQTLGS